MPLDYIRELLKATLYGMSWTETLSPSLQFPSEPSISDEFSACVASIRFSLVLSTWVLTGILVALILAFLRSRGMRSANGSGGSKGWSSGILEYLSTVQKLSPTDTFLIFGLFWPGAFWLVDDFPALEDREMPLFDISVLHFWEKLSMSKVLVSGWKQLLYNSSKLSCREGWTSQLYGSGTICQACGGIAARQDSPSLRGAVVVWPIKSVHLILSCPFFSMFSKYSTSCESLDDEF